MITCPNCKAVNEDTNSFCGECGAKLQVEQPSGAITNNTQANDNVFGGNVDSSFNTTNNTTNNTTINNFSADESVECHVCGKIGSKLSGNFYRCHKCGKYACTDHFDKAYNMCKSCADAKKAEERRIAEEKRRVEEARLAEERRIAEEKRKVEEARKAEEERKAEEKRKAEEARRAEQERRLAEARRIENERRMAQWRKEEEKRRAEAARIAEEKRKAEALRAEERRREEEAIRAEKARKAKIRKRATIAGASATAMFAAAMILPGVFNQLFCEHLNQVTTPGYAATCDQEGRTDMVECVDCSATLTRAKSIPAIGHNYASWETVNESPVKLCANDGCNEYLDISYISTNYSGQTLFTGETVNKSDISITAELSDGSIENITDFALENNLITHGGDNKINITFGNAKTNVYVPAIHANLPNTASINDFEYYKSGNSITITKYIGKDTDVVIPAHIGRVPVKVLEKSAFSGTQVQSVTIPGSVETIGENCFYSCSSLTSVTLNEGLKTIKSEAFRGCPITSIVIPDSVTNIERYYKYNSGYGTTTIYGAFQGCTKLTSVVIGNGLKAIEGNTFCGCTALTSVVIGDSVKTIGESAFYGCSSLTSVTIGSGVTTIGKDAFSRCSSLESIEIPGSVETIGENCFIGCSSLTSVTLNEGLKTIKSEAFRGCPITSIVIPDSVTDIQHYYKYNSAYGATTIYGAFEGCTKLTSVTIGKGIKTIVENTFYGCSAITSVHYNGTEEEWANVSVLEGNTALKQAEFTYGN